MIGVVVAAIYQWVQAVGGLENAWAIAMDYIQYGTDLTAYGISYGVTWVLNSLDRMELGAATLSTNFQELHGRYEGRGAYSASGARQRRYRYHQRFYQYAQ